MTEPCSTGIGGDMFCLFYNATTKTVHALNGSGRSGANCTLAHLLADLGSTTPPTKIPMSSVHAVTVPGAAAGWADTIAKHGSGTLSLAQILAPAIALGEDGFPVSELTAHAWALAEGSIRAASPNFAEMLKADPKGDGGCRAPRAGEIMRNANLARTFRALGEQGKEGFYRGRVAEALVKVVQDLGGRLELADLEHHLQVGSEPVAPISLQFHGQGLSDADALELWEHPPNGQGIVALMALGILQELEKQGKIPRFTPAEHNSTAYLHAVIEALRFAFADAAWFVADPAVGAGVPAAELISPAYLAERAKLFDPTRASDGSVGHGSPALQSADTVYFAVADGAGNAISFINSNYGGFGTAIVPAGCGFTLQNRGANFALAPPEHPNLYAPAKRPYHTIIPGLVTNVGDGSLHSVFGVMGGFMQPQGHVQTLLGQVIAGLSPQQALDAPRICIGSSMEDVDMTVSVEEGMPAETIEGLRKLGHKVEVLTDMQRPHFGRGQIIRWTLDPVEGRGVWSAGSDQRGDGAAYPA